MQDLIAVYRELARRCDYPLHLGLTEAGMGSKGIVASTAALSVLLQQGIGDTIRISLTPEPGGDRAREVIVGAGNPADHGAACVHADGDRVPGLRAHDQHVVPGTGVEHPELSARPDAGLEGAVPGVENMHVAVMGCIVNGPGESKQANIGISLPGSGESPVAPVFIDGEAQVTLQAASTSRRNSRRSSGDYVERRYGRPAQAETSDQPSIDRARLNPRPSRRP